MAEGHNEEGEKRLRKSRRFVDQVLGLGMGTGMGEHLWKEMASGFLLNQSQLCTIFYLGFACN